MLGISHAVFMNEKDWEKHDPILLLKNYRNSHKPQFFVTIGRPTVTGFKRVQRNFIVSRRKRDFQQDGFLFLEATVVLIVSPQPTSSWGIKDYE